jgi:hypothetical protein
VRKVWVWSARKHERHSGLEIIGNFIRPTDAYRNVLALVRAGKLDPVMITPKAYRLEELPGDDGGGRGRGQR